MYFYLECVVVFVIVVVVVVLQLLLLLSFNSSTALLCFLSGIARLNPVTLSKFGATCNKRKTLHQSSCTCTKKRSRSSEADKSTCGNSANNHFQLEMMGKLRRTLWGQRMWGLPKLSELNRSDRVPLSFLKKPSSASEACSSDKVCLMSLKWVNQRGWGRGPDDECSLAPRLAPSHLNRTM